MKIIVTDGYTLNPGDISWEPISALGQLKVYDRSLPRETLARCVDASIILTNKTPLSGDIIRQLPNLKMIGVTATGYNVVDTAVAKELGVPVCNVPGYGTASVAQHTIALMLELVNQVGMHSASVRMGEWSTAVDWCYSILPITELDGKILGIVGMGSIGKRVAAIAEALGMTIIYHSRTQKPALDANYVDLDELFRKADIVSLHCPLTADNSGFVNASLLKTMKPTALLINTARGALINENDLATALNKKVIAGAALDVLSVEPPASGNPLLHADNCIITPHQAWLTKEARQRIMDATVKNIIAFLDGSPVNLVNA